VANTKILLDIIVIYLLTYWSWMTNFRASFGPKRQERPKDQKLETLTVSCHPHLQKFILNKTKTRFFDIVTFEILKSFNLLPLTNRWTLLSSIFVSANLLICNCKITLKGLISSQNVSFYQYLWHKKVGRIYHEKRGLPVFVFLPQSVTFYLNGPLNLAWLCLDVWEHFDRS